MRTLKIRGGTPLIGTIPAAGAKNATTKLLVASLLSNKKCTFYNVPNILDVQITLDMCREIGMEAVWDKEAHKLEVQTKELKTTYMPQRFSGANRIPILMIGALLARGEQEVIVPVVGGDAIGARPVHFHMQALKTLGAHIEYRAMKRDGAYFASAPNGLQGDVISLPYPSVGATENSILAAICAKGTTVIKNAANEPEIVDLILFLQKLGAIISVDVDRTIYIQGTRKFYDVEHTILPDRIETASYAMAAIATKGRVYIKGASHLNMIFFLNTIREVGGNFCVHNDGIEFFWDGPLQGGVHVETDVYPGFATDWQQPFCVLLTQAEGTSILHETVYENRFGYVSQLIDMGADIARFRECLGSKSCRFSSHAHYHSVVVKGPTPLHPTNFTVPDLRAGFAYIMAAILAQGESRVSGIEHVERGYEHLLDKLQALGADIEYCDATNQSREQESLIPIHRST